MKIKTKHNKRNVFYVKFVDQQIEAIIRPSNEANANKSLIKKPIDVLNKFRVHITTICNSESLNY